MQLFEHTIVLSYNSINLFGIISAVKRHPHIKSPRKHPPCKICMHQTITCVCNLAINDCECNYLSMQLFQDRIPSTFLAVRSAVKRHPPCKKFMPEILAFVLTSFSIQYLFFWPVFIIFCPRSGEA